MSNITRSVLLVLIVSVGMASAGSSSAQPIETKSQVLARTSVDGKFSRYLESPNGDIDGIVLEDGTVARVTPFKRAAQTMPFRPGDAVRVEGDTVSGLTRQYLVHALVTRSSFPTTRGAIPPPPPIGSAAAGPRSRGAGKYGKSSLKDSSQPLQSAGKSRSPAADRSRRVDDVLVVDRTTLRARKKNRLETIESKASEATTGKDKSGDYSQWRRSQETAGP
jgi:hypothetical protein